MGEPAFPYSFDAGEGLGTVVAQGMSLRDWFAGMALQGLLAESAHPQSIGSVGNEKSLAKQSYALADAMLAQREEGA